MRQEPERGDDQAPPYSTIWERAARDSAKPRVSLSYERIATAAVEIADSEGLPAVSMRKLAHRLGVATMATYRYVSSKDDLYQLMIDTCHAEIRLLPEALSDWRSALRSYAEEIRAMTIRHPWIAEVPELLPGNLTPHMVEVVEQVLQALNDLDADVDSKMAMLGATSAFVRGAAAAEVGQQHMKLRHGWADDDELRDAYHPYMSGLVRSGNYPRLADYLVDGSNRDDGSWQFEFGLSCLIEGMAARLDT